jgi:predicted ATPase
LITEIEVKNFKTLRDVKIPLAPGITVMVGANNSGKSNALAAIKLLAESLRQSPSDALRALGGWSSALSREAAGLLKISAAAPIAGISVVREIFQPKRGEQRLEAVTGYLGAEPENWEYFHEQSMRLENFLHSTTVQDLAVSSLRKPAVVHRDAKLGPDGLDVAAMLDVLAGEQPALRDAIDEAVRRSAHEVKRVVTRPGPEPGTKVLGVEEKDGRVYGADDMSDGLLLFIGLAVAAQLKANTPCILAIEEPERGIHPRRLRDLVDHLLQLTKSGVQVVLTTHSPTLLDEFRDTPESVLIFDRDEKGTHITRLSDRPDWARELQGAPLGELWYSGVLGGVPGR